MAHMRSDACFILCSPSQFLGLLPTSSHEDRGFSLPFSAILLPNQEAIE
jgi:hypothetical protein